MTPLKLIVYSLIAVGDGLAVLFLLSILAALTKGWVRDWIKIYFDENESFLRRLGHASPMDVRTRMLD